LENALAGGGGRGESYYSAPRRRTVDGSRYAFTLLRFYAFASAFASLLICKPRVLDGLWTHDCLQVPLSCGSSTQLGARDMGHDLADRERTSASQHSLSLLKRPRSRCRYQATESGPQASSISRLDKQSCGVSPALLPVSSLKG
jgi:hypothetical protein